MKKKYLLLNVLFLTFSSFFAQNPVPTVEYQALVDFYNAMGGDNWLTKWDISTNNLHTTTWHGVVVEDEHIVEINLPNNRIVGAIPSSFSNLKSLKKLNLGSTTTSSYYTHDLSTSNLDNLSGLESLEELSLRHCKIAGSLPASLSQLTNLQSLTVSNNSLTGTIFNEVGNLTALKTIDLSYNTLDAIPATIANLTNLETLYLQNNAFKVLPQVMENLTSLTYLNLYYNQITTIEAFLSTNVTLYLNYQTITFDEFTFNGDDVILTDLPNITQYNRSTNDFSARNNFYLRINGSNVATNIPMNAEGNIVISKEHLNALTADKQVSLYQQSGNASGTNINFTNTIVDLPAIPESEYQALVDFYNATQGDNWLNQWDVSTNNLNLGAWYGMAIEDGHITEINLTNNRIIGAIPASFSDLKFLKKLNLGATTSSYYTHDFSTTDLANLSGLESLEELNLRHCKITGTLPASWSQLTNLKALVMSNNSLTGTIFNEIGSLTALETIDFSNNTLDAIPVTIANLTNLETLNLQNNALKTLPQVMENLTSLTTLNLYYNQISTIEAFLNTSVNLYLNYQTITFDEFTYSNEDVVLTDLPNITKYNRSANDFSARNNFYLRIDGSNVATNIPMNAEGNIVISKEHLNALTAEKQVTLYQQSGNASGTNMIFTNTIVNLPEIPESEYQALVDFYNATQGDEWLNQWDVSTNNLSQGAWYGMAIEDGHITEINLPNNRIVGAIPASFSDLKFLKKLNLGATTSSSYYTSDLSSTDLGNLSGLESLEDLNLRYCNISDAFPSSWSQLTNLKSIVASNNGLSGSIFSDIGSLTALENLDLSYNNIDAIPSTIANLTNLKTINLRDNALTTLPQVMENLTSLTTLNLYYNQISTIEAFLNTSINLYLNYQTITFDDFTYNGDGVVLTDLPNITKYNRSANDFSARNNFYLRIDGSNVATNILMNEDGNIVIPKENINTLTAEKQVTLYQQSGNASGTNINFTNTIVDLPEIPESEYQALVDFYNATQGEDWLNQWDVSTNNLSQGAWYGMAIEDGHITEINLPNNRIVGAIPASFSDLKSLKKLNINSTTTSTYYTHDLSTTNLDNLSGLESLEELNLGYCNITGALPASWSQLTNLKSIALRNNSITSIPEAIGNLSNLESLDFRYNSITNSDTNFSGLQLTTLDFRYQDINIESIEIVSNEINIDLPTPFLFQLNNGVVTDDGNNEFQLYVNNVYEKTSFSNNGKLIFFNINLLNLEATDKIRIYQMNGSAAYSNINYNTITFGVPLVDEEFEILKALYNATNGDSWTNSWDISVNNLNTVSWFGVSIKDGHVVSINLFNNNLSGILPEDITGLSYLKTLSLNNNNISGSIPQNINLLPDLETLDLSSNALSGTIPANISDLQKLKKFAIGNNNFSGTIPAVLSDFVALEHLDISSNSFDHVEKKLYYDFSNTYIDLRNQVINYNTILNLEGTELTVELGNISTYDLENNNFDAKNTFVLLVDDVTHTSTTTNESGDIIFDDVRIGEIPLDAEISIRQTTGTFRNTEFNYSGIEDKSNIPVLEEEYLALVELYNQLNGEEWINTWDITSNNMHNSKWYGVTTYDGHVVAIDLSSNNVSNSVPSIFDDLPYLNTLNLSSNNLTGITGALPAHIDFIYDRQTIEMGEIDLNMDTSINDLSINKYEHAKEDFFNQTYNLRIGSFSRTVNLPDEGIKLIDLIKTWRVPNNQHVELRQTSGEAKNSIINYYLTYQSGDSNLDSEISVLDLQTSINYIVNNYVNYFNFNAADINSDSSINVLDIVGEVNLIQNQAPNPEGKRNAEKDDISNAVSSKVSIENGILMLDTNNNEVASFEIIITDTSKNQLEELITPLGYSVSIANKGNHASIIAYAFNSTLNGKIEIAKIGNRTSSIQSVILSDINAVEIPSEILDNTLDINEFEIEESPIIFNYPNPFIQETLFNFSVNTTSDNGVLSIYDISGRNLKNIQIGKLNKGKNLYLFKRENLSSGIYLYKLSSQDYNLILEGKMIIK